MNILLDLDGTLTDPREGIVKCMRHALTELHHACPSDSELERYIGPPLHQSFAAIFGAGSAKVDRAIELYRERFSATGMFENRVKPTIFSERIIEYFGLGSDIRAVFGSELDGTRSDKAELIAQVLKTEAMDPRATCMVGDRAHDMQGACANQIVPIGALWGYGSRRELLDAGALALCEKPADLCELLSSG